MYCVKVETRGHVLRLDSLLDPIRTPCTILIRDEKIDSVRGILDNMLLKYSYAKIKPTDSETYERKQSAKRMAATKKRNPLNKKLSDGNEISFSGKVKRR